VLFIPFDDREPLVDIARCVSGESLQPADQVSSEILQLLISHNNDGVDCEEDEERVVRTL
jgi:hypothetical protein